MFWDSSEETNIDVTATGNINNNMVLEIGKDIGKDVDNYGSLLIILVSIICAIKIFVVFTFFYKEHNRRLKKKYNNPTTIEQKRTEHICDMHMYLITILPALGLPFVNLPLL